MPAPPEHDLLERAQLSGRRVEGDHLPFEDRLARAEPRLEDRHDIGELAADALLPAGEQLDPAVGGAVRLDPDAVVLVLGRALPAQPGQDLRGVGGPLGEHGAHRVAGAHLQPLDRRHPATGQSGGDQAEVAADVVAAFQHRPGGPATGVHLRERVQDGGGADAQPQAAGDQAEQVAGLQRGGLGEQAGQQVQLATLRALPFGLGDPVQGVDHRRDLQARRSAGGDDGEQLLAGLPEVAGLPHAESDLLGTGAGGGGDRADGELLGQPEVHAGELRRDQALAQVADGREQLGGGLGQQRGEPVDQRQPGGRLLQVAVRVGDDLVLHGAPSTQGS